MRDRDYPTRLLGLGTALPPHKARQHVLRDFMVEMLCASTVAGKRTRGVDLVRRLCDQSGIETRYSVIPDFACATPKCFRFFPPRWDLEPFPRTRERMLVYEDASVELAADAARDALADAAIPASAVTHLVLATCTGFFAPGPDVSLVRELGLAPDVQRLHIGFMGCYAALSALRAADHIVASDPQAVVLQVCIELCSLHFQKRPDADLLLANSLFSDGAAAAVYGGCPDLGRGHAEVVATASRLEVEAGDQMTWRIGDFGFEMRLSVDVPRQLAAGAPSFVRDLARKCGWDEHAIPHWAIHPGGRRILEVLAAALELAPQQLDASTSVLRDYGNMSSGTMLFVLKRLLQTKERRGPLLALGFGPGLTTEGAALRIL